MSDNSLACICQKDYRAQLNRADMICVTLGSEHLVMTKHCDFLTTIYQY